MKTRIPTIIALFLFGVLLILGVLSAHICGEERICVICCGSKITTEVRIFGLIVFNTVDFVGESPRPLEIHKVSQHADHVYIHSSLFIRNIMPWENGFRPITVRKSSINEEGRAHGWASQLVRSHTPPDCTIEEKAKLYQSIYGAVHANLLPSVDIKELYKTVRTNDECVVESFIEGLTLNR